MIRYFLWGKRVGESIIKPFAILDVFSGSPSFSILERLRMDSSQQNLWVLLAIRLHIYGYSSIFPPIWDDKGHINEFWLSDNNVIVDEIPEANISEWSQNYPILYIW